jgi:hypothetical protein
VSLPVTDAADGVNISGQTGAAITGILADLEGRVMADKKHNSPSDNEAQRTFRSRDNKPLTEYEQEQRALHKNLERLRAERLAREAAKSKDK